jgi:hypothetical protein
LISSSSTRFFCLTFFMETLNQSHPISQAGNSNG